MEGGEAKKGVRIGAKSGTLCCTVCLTPAVALLVRNRLC
jgi:hypothetical protein